MKKKAESKCPGCGETEVDWILTRGCDACRRGCEELLRERFVEDFLIGWDEAPQVKFTPASRYTLSIKFTAIPEGF